MIYCAQSGGGRHDVGVDGGRPRRSGARTHAVIYRRDVTPTERASERGEQYDDDDGAAPKVSLLILTLGGICGSKVNAFS